VANVYIENEPGAKQIIFLDAGSERHGSVLQDWLKSTCKNFYGLSHFAFEGVRAFE